jgi:hypothetical protein
MGNPFDRRLVVAGLASALALAACSGGASPSPTPSAGPSGSPGPSPTPAVSPEASPTGATGSIVHPTGSADIVLRFEEGGGFTMPAFAMVQVPAFVLYGDGTVIYRPASEPFPEVKPGEPMRFPALRVARMTEDQVQALLAAALGAGGLGVARERYENMQVADAPTAVFTLDADGRQKQVSVYALGMWLDDPANPNPDGPIIQAMATLAERLRNFDREIAGGNATEAGLYAPTQFRASLLEGGPGGDGVPRPWPWPTFGPDEFVADPTSTFTFPSRVLSGVEVSLLGLEDPAGGVSGISVIGPNGIVYGLALRPLLPGETR